jgi:hypothetical protein
MMSLSKTLRGLCAAGLVLGAATVSRADTLVTFTVDMNAELNAILNNSTVYLRGNFNGQDFTLLPAHILTNNGSGVFSGTINITDAPGTVIRCKFYYNNPGDVWEDGADRQFVLADGTQVLPLTAWNEKYPLPLNNVTFRVDMGPQITLGNFTPGQNMRVSGVFTGWGDGVDMTNEAPSTVYSQTIAVAGLPGAQINGYKFRANDGWENDGVGPGGAQNRSFILAGGDQVLPLVYYNNLPPNVPTNAITFQVDMTAQILLGNFTPGQFIRVSGNMYSPTFGDGRDLTNNPALSGNASNIYSTVIDVIANAGTTYNYKFRANGGWESPTSTGGGDRSFQVAGGPQVLPLVFYSDASPCDMLTEPTAVTFVLRLTNGTPAFDGTVYDGSQTVHINGEFNGWAAWDVLLPQMVNNPVGSDFYEYTHNFPAGATRAQKFKFSIGGPDNEAGFAADHIQYIRSTGPTYTMPVSEFGTNYASVRVEQAFGNLQVGAPVGGNVPITWLGLPCVTLQTRSDLTGGNWVNLPATDATSATNWPNTGNAFFRLQKRSSP